MSEIAASPFTTTIVLRGGGLGQNLIYEGDIDMSQEQAEALKQIIGDGLAKVTASKELSHKDYGNGGSVFVSVTLTCDQSQQGIETAAQWANYFAEKSAVEQHGTLKQTLAQLGITQ